jgi:precorrin-2 dehydrogenase / sirohydrochlorin ferrochelatase
MFEQHQSSQQAQAAYPLVLTRLDEARCVVVGGGAVAERKVAELIVGGARPVVVGPRLTPQLERYAREGRITALRRAYQAGDLAGALLAFAATNDQRVNQAVAAEAQQRGVLVNVADDPADGSFHTVATIRRGDLLLTVSTGGASPGLAAQIRRELYTRYGAEYALLVALLKQLRVGPAQALAPARRALLWQRLLNAPLLEWLRNGDAARAERYANEQLDELRDTPALPKET